MNEYRRAKYCVVKPIPVPVVYDIGFLAQAMTNQTAVSMEGREGYVKELQLQADGRVRVGFGGENEPPSMWFYAIVSAR